MIGSQLAMSQLPMAYPNNSINAAATIAAIAASRSKPSWPPNFDTHGASYVFQSQSGYFFEPLSQFYYCPKSKLYYNSNDGSYYHYDMSISPPFILFSPPEPSESYESVMAASSAATTDSTAAPVSIVKKPVILSLGNVKNKAKSTPISSAFTKQAANDIAKWATTQIELHEDEEEPEDNTVMNKKQTVSAPEIIPSAITSNVEVPASNPVTTTKVP
jgi:hypothetical protein